MQLAIETKTARISFSEGVLILRNLPEAIVDLKEVKEDVNALKRLARGAKRPFLADIRNLKKMKRAAREYGRLEGNTIFSCTALLVDNAISTIIGNFFLGLNKTDHPTRIFRDEKKAFQWLSENSIIDNKYAPK